LLPTTLGQADHQARYAITDTGKVSEQLDEAQRRWPDLRDRKELLLRLAAAGRAATEREATERSDAIRQTAGTLTGAYRSSGCAKTGRRDRSRRERADRPSGRRRPPPCRCASLLEVNSQEPPGASPITLAETLASPTRAGRLADAETALRRLGVQE
jgi:hypothetical protein